MADIDPIEERRQREEQERKNQGLKKTMYIMIGVAAALFILLAYIWISIER